MLRVASLTAILTLALSTPAMAGVTAQLTPNTAGAGAHLGLDVAGQDGGLRSRQIPSGLAIGFQKGFAFDPNAVAGTCTDPSAASKGQCPANSIVGTGSVEVFAEGYAFGPNGQHFTAALTFYKAPPQAPGDPMGVVFYFREPQTGYQDASFGRLMPVADPVLGMAVRWDKLPIPNLPQGLYFTLQHLKVDLGAGAATPPVRVTTSHKKHRRHRRHHRHRASAAQSGPALMTNPTSCAGTWRIQLEVDYSSAADKHDVDAACTP